MGDRVLPDVLPILRAGLDSGDAATRAGVCVGLAEVIEASSERQLEEHMDELMPAIRVSLCDALPAVRGGGNTIVSLPVCPTSSPAPPLQVRDAAARAFSTLQAALGAEAIAAVVPGLLASVEDPDQSEGGQLPPRTLLPSDLVSPPLWMQATRRWHRRSRACATSSPCARAPVSCRCCCRD